MLAPELLLGVGAYLVPSSCSRFKVKGVLWAIKAAGTLEPSPLLLPPRLSLPFQVSLGCPTDSASLTLTVVQGW